MTIIKSRYYYITSLCFVFIIPGSIIGFFVFDKISLLNFFLFVVSMTILGGMWDIWATRHGKRDRIWLWQFNLKDTLGIKAFGLPIEEFIFYLVSSCYIIFLWEGIKYALASHNLFLYILLPFLGVWSLIFISIPYLFRVKNDKI